LFSPFHTIAKNILGYTIKLIGTYFKKSRSRPRARREPTQKRSPPEILADEHFKEARNPPAAD
jgi:hypothetical protein